jgi:hypothetical protein
MNEFLTTIENIGFTKSPINNNIYEYEDWTIFINVYYNSGIPECRWHLVYKHLSDCEVCHDNNSINNSLKNLKILNNYFKSELREIKLQELGI